MRTVAADDFLGGRNARAVDERVQMAEGAEREIDGGLAVVLAGDVGEAKRAAAPSSAARASPAARLMSAMTTDAAFGDEQPRGGCAEPGCATGDKEDMVADLH